MGRSKYPTEQALINLVNDLADELRDMERGDPAQIAVVAKLKLARKALAAHREAIRQCENEAR